MNREVVLTSRAISDLDEAVSYLAEQSATAAMRWCNSLEGAIAQLEAGLIGFGSAREEELFAFNLRQHCFGAGRKPTHRLVFREYHDRVVVYAVRHLARNDLRIEDLS